MQPTLPPSSSTPSTPNPPAIPVLPPARRPVRPDTARWILWSLLAVFALIVAGSFSIPRAGLSVHLFDALFPPSPSLLRSLAIVAAVLTLPILFAPRLRIWFGPGFLIRPFRAPIPGALALLAGGIIALFAAGLLDGFWLSGQSASETTWSFPVALAAWAMLVIVLGFVACRVALIPLKPLRWYSAIFLGWLVLEFSFAPITGPLGANPAPILLIAARYVSGLLADPGVQHVYRIYLGANLTRTNPFFLPFAAFWAGAGLAFLRVLDRRAWVLLATTTLWTALTLSTTIGDVQRLDHFLNTDLMRDPRTWAAVPLLPTAGLFVILIKLGLPERSSWVLAGLLFGVLTLGIWGNGPFYVLMALVASAVLLFGATAGKHLAHALADPTAAHVRSILLVAALYPLALGCLDLLLRLAIR